MGTNHMHIGKPTIDLYHVLPPKEEISDQLTEATYLPGCKYKSSSTTGEEFQGHEMNNLCTAATVIGPCVET